ncbi:tetratricopeptide repeat protein [Natronoflexus pectinivorans]|uniref:WD40 repeat protein n=1 Tax=Natronoflexus pectinivorans TaxID=682526 RepID=A0A4R2GJ77_9BACT|nr:tetratricopeptide repeat protein [Natronoflexus pectinivorans]TCO07400.1 WD40 repeat protein [Natronoflexus pectinivorans]
MVKGLLWSVVLVLVGIGDLVFAQQTQVSAQNALSLFNDGKYAEAKEMYERLLERNNRDHALNYYYGLILYKTNERPDEAIRRLRLAANRPPSPDVHFYLGKLYQRAYEFDLAKSSFERFLNTQRSASEVMVQTAKRGIEDSEASNVLINKYFDLQVIRKDTVPRNEMLNHYKLSKDAGQLMRAGDFFRVGVNPEQVIFRTERGDEVFFPILGSGGTYDLHKIMRLLDSWTDAEAFDAPVNSEYNDSYPFMLIDGTTLYFSSDRPGGMGGYDIYQTIFDPVTGTFSEPSNLGPPFNSPDDDFLLVPDVYEGKAWFTTNRGVGEDMVIVVEIVWDNSVVRHFTEDINQIRSLAYLPVSESARARASSTTYARSDVYETEDHEPGFRFFINDTLIYTSYDHFMSQQALSLFQQGRELEAKKDSLYNRMNDMRRRYAQSYNQSELQRLIDEIIKIEREVYGLEEEINRIYLNARRRELEKINELKARGEYRPTTVATAKQAFVSVNQRALSDLNKSDLTFYSDDEFVRRRERLKQMYNALFNQDQKNELLRSDSLYVWANILSLESARLLERTQNVAIEPASLRDRITGNNNIQDEIDYKVQSLRLQSRELKLRSLELYELALDQKFSIYYPKAQEIGGTSHRAGSEHMLSQARSNFSEAERGLDAIHSYNPERTERYLALKRHGVDMMEESFLMQLAGVPDQPVAQRETSSRFMDFNAGATTPSYPAIHRGSESAVRQSRQQPSEMVAAAFGQPAEASVVEEPVVNREAQSPPTQQTSERPEYRIQIGVFRNEPNAAALAKIPPVTSEYLPDRGLSRYYSGSWRTHQEAAGQVQSIIDAGFPGAYVVAFLNGELITVQKAKSLE